MRLDYQNKALARTMQALRIEVNQEFAALDALLQSIPETLAQVFQIKLLIQALNVLIYGNTSSLSPGW